MIQLKDLNGNDFVLNCDLIQTIELIPETKISLTDGKYFLVSNTYEEIIERVIDYKKNVYGVNKRIEVVREFQPN